MQRSNLFTSQNQRISAALAVAALLCLCAPAVHAQEQLAPLTPTALTTALGSAKENKDLLAQRIRTAFGADKLKTGAPPKTDNAPEGLTLAWAIEAPDLKEGDAPQVITDDPALPQLRLQRVGKTDVYAGTTFLAKGLAGHWSYVVHGQTMGSGQYEDYPLSKDGREQPGVPKGKLTQMPPWHSKIFDGTTRDWWVYTPAQATGPNGTPLGVIVFQDGGGAKNWAPTILDNLIAKGDIPPVVGIFINPSAQRSVEYDTLSDRYAQFLLDEILPEVSKQTPITPNPNERALWGVSSGGICAFTVAWERPDAFRKVVSCVGSFTNLQGGPTGVAGGNTYPAIIRHSAGWNHEGKAKPIRVFLSDGANDLDNAAGSWPLANQEMAKALAYAGYDYRFVYGNGFHGDRYGRYVFADALRWLWSR